MTTDADRQRAWKIMARHDQMAGHVIKDREYLELEIAAAIAAARAEALEQAAKLMMDIYCLPGCASAIRALKEPGHGK